MGVRMRLTSVETVYEERSWLFTVRNQHGDPEEVILVPCTDGEAETAPPSETAVEEAAVEETTAENRGVEAWVNQCTHEFQRLDVGRGVAMRDGQIICPKHGSMFDSCSGYCDNGEAADTTLPSIEVAVDRGDVYLTDDDVTFMHQGGIDDGDDGPSSTSHLSL
ncbi:Rieske (2Fe-2S) domain-containing protein [Natrialba hulunbeirensis JCM 10989]|uniref:Rieske (2Fe-2S) domain-containing protein n=1 Tax=Natrialba hulunbeirensis JCM 10989 TaxID=1227493 RepID=M0A435_9EURY|nr:Rieske 2Fe-2S domain-containing protein [Natrialba hulunbeirensis]ELY93354.1 Rieske (2Fe-2S) domain-containing protein [Natrialba hulunbeirensis JCM 10989]